MKRTITLSGIVGSAGRRPRIVVSLLRAAWRFRARGWWRRFPFLPVPPPEYVEWRFHTAYGEEGRDPTAEELDRYLHWANRMYATRRREIEVR